MKNSLYWERDGSSSSFRSAEHDCQSAKTAAWRTTSGCGSSPSGRTAAAAAGSAQYSKHEEVAERGTTAGTARAGRFPQGEQGEVQPRSVSRGAPRRATSCDVLSRNRHWRLALGSWRGLPSVPARLPPEPAAGGGPGPASSRPPPRVGMPARHPQGQFYERAVPVSVPGSKRFLESCYGDIAGPLGAPRAGAGGRGARGSRAPTRPRRDLNLRLTRAGGGPTCSTRSGRRASRAARALPGAAPWRGRARRSIYLPRRSARSSPTLPTRRRYQDGSPKRASVRAGQSRSNMSRVWPMSTVSKARVMEARGCSCR